MRKRRIAEPYKIKAVEPLKMLSMEERKDNLEKLATIHF